MALGVVARAIVYIVTRIRWGQKPAGKTKVPVQGYPAWNPESTVLFLGSRVAVLGARQQNQCASFESHMRFF